MVILPEDKLKRIHTTSMRILEETGVRLDHGPMSERLLDSGCHQDGGRIHFPAVLIQSVVEDIPAQFSLYGRSNKDEVTVGQDVGIRFSNCGIMPYIYDFETGIVRMTNLDDVSATTRMLDAVSNVDLVYVSLVDATETAPHMKTVKTFSAVVSNTIKPFVGPGVVNAAEAKTVLKIARALQGSEEGEFAKTPTCVPFISPITPLKFPKDTVDALIVIAEAGVPLDIVSNPVMGLTSPYSIASCVALGHAEVLAAACMAHCISPGLPILNHNTPSVADMHSMSSTTGGPETGLIRSVVAQLSAYLGIPAFVHGHTSSTMVDYQAADEKVRNLLLIAAGAPAILGGLGAMANASLSSYESIVLDNETYGSIKRAISGVLVDDDHLAYEVIAKNVDDGDFLSSAHTIKFLRSSEVWQPDIANRVGLVGGIPAARSSVEIARDKAREILGTHEVDVLPEHIKEEIHAILSDHDNTVSE